MSNKTPPGTTELPRSVLISYSSMAFAPAMFYLIISAMLPQLYAKELGLALTQIGIALLSIRVCDAFLDQIVGILSDRTRTRFGARKPWIVVGTAITVVACYFLFMPPKDVGIAYFAFWRIVYDIGWTMSSIAFSAWGAELTTSYADRSRINGYSGISSNAAIILKNIAPIVLFWLGITETSAFSMEMFKYLFWMCLPIIVIITAVCVTITPVGVHQPRERPDLLSLLRSVRGNMPFWYYLAGFLVASLAGGIASLLFTFYDSYLKLGPWYPYLMMGFGVVTVLAIPLWVKLANRFGKHRAYAASLFAQTLAMQSFWLIRPEQHSQATVALIGACILFLIAAATACVAVAPPAILGDVVDYDRWRTGVSRAGSYFAFQSLTMKIAMAVGTSAGFILLDVFHYDVKAGAINTPEATSGLLVTVLLVPGILNVIGGLILWRFPLDERRHAILQRRLARHKALADAAEVEAAQLADQLAVDTTGSGRNEAVGGVPGVPQAVPAR